jgi:TusA-related sulfurtransferase
MAPVVVDALGKACPIPVVELARVLPEVGIGQEVVVLADDPGVKADIPAWCRMKSQEFLGLEEAEVGWRLRVRRVA